MLSRPHSDICILPTLFLKWVGVTPVNFLNAVLNDDLELNPTS